MKLADADAAAKLEEIEAMARRKPATLRRLLDLSWDPDAEIRWRAIEVLSRSTDAKVLTRLRQGLLDLDEIVRVESIEALAALDDRAAVPGIRACLHDADELVRKAAALALALLDDRAVIPLLEGQARRGSELERANALAGLVLLGKSAYLRRLLNLLRSSDYLTRSAVSNVLAVMAPRLDRPMTDAALAALDRALAIEATKAARSSLSTAIGELRRAEHA
jgi:serine/threonine-protein kinase